MDLVRSERLEAPRPGVHRIEVAYREIERLGAGRRSQATRRRVEHCENHAPAIKVVTRSMMPLALGAEQLGVERGRLLDVRDLEGDAENLRSVRLAYRSHRRLPFRFDFVVLPLP